jgi:hypothetical protein
MEFIEAPAFTRHVSEYMADDEYRELQDQLARNPELGDLIPDTGNRRVPKTPLGRCEAW